MALPKEPRQKMINMMYLVLTALLALNVSSEILNAFKVVNNSIGTSNSLISAKNDATYKQFSKDLEKAETKAQAQIWAPRATDVQKISADMFSYIENLKQELKKESKLKVDKNGVETFSEDNLDAATRLMDKNGKGKELYDKLGAYKNQVLAALKVEEFQDPNTKAKVAAAIEGFRKSIPIDLNVPKGQSGKEYSNDAKGWTTNYFHMTPTIAALTILSKFQNDVKNTEAQIVDYCHQQIGAVEVIYDEFEAIAQANTSYAMAGDDIEITAGVGAFSAAAKPTISINGQIIPLSGGKAVYKTKASGVGERTIPVKIEYTKPNGEKAVKNEMVKYTVGTPSGASVFLEKMNVLYIGVDNPLTISGGSTGSERVKVSFPNGTITKVSGDRYIAKPAGNPALSKIIVNADGKNYEFPMRVKSLPNPAGFVGAKKGGAIGAAEFKAIGALIAKLEDSDFEAPFRVVSYKLAAIGGGITTYTEAVNEGNRWNGSAAAIVQRATPGTNIFFDNIRVVGPDGKNREIQPMVFSLK